MKTACIHPGQKAVKKGYSQAEIETFSRILQTTTQLFKEEQVMVQDVLLTAGPIILPSAQASPRGLVTSGAFFWLGFLVRTGK